MFNDFLKANRRSAHTKKFWSTHRQKTRRKRMNFFFSLRCGSDGRQITWEFKKKRKPPRGHRLFPFISVYWNAVPQNDWNPTTRFDQLRPQNSFHWRQHTANDDIKTGTREEEVGWQPSEFQSSINTFKWITSILYMFRNTLSSIWKKKISNRMRNLKKQVDGLCL